MEDIYNDINKLISSKLPPYKTNVILALLEIDSELKEEFKILLHSREYLIAKSGLVEFEKDPDRVVAKDLVQNHYINK